jgi:hypothetical protein
VDALAKRLHTIDSLDRERDVVQHRSLRVSYDLDGKAIGQMRGATQTIRALQSALHVEIGLNRVTNPWTNVGLRNAWDQVDHSGSVLGFAASGVAALEGAGKKNL